MKAIILTIMTISLVSCASPKPKRPKTYSQRMDACISKYLDKGIESAGAVKVCETILKRRK